MATLTAGELTSAQRHGKSWWICPYVTSSLFFHFLTIRWHDMLGRPGFRPCTPKKKPPPPPNCGACGPPPLPSPPTLGGKAPSNRPPPPQNGGDKSSNAGFDLNIRFSKFDFVDPESLEPMAGTNNALLPLQPSDYPIGGNLGISMKSSSTAISVTTSDDFGLRGVDEEAFYDAIGGPPTYPNSNPNHPFWTEFVEVMQIQLYRLDDVDNTDILPFKLPDLWADFDLEDVAEAVNDEYPGFWQAWFLEHYFPKMKMDTTIFPFRSLFDFVGGPIRVAAINTWATETVAPINFRAKWSYGRPRPEEVAYLLYTGAIDYTYAPTEASELEAKLHEEHGAKTAPQFTAYDVGSPRHPSWPAMHSAASSASFWMSVVLDMDEYDYCQALLTDYAVSYARTVAGVHYYTDNLDGLNLGQKIVAHYLEDYLVEKYGADRNAARAKIEAKQFDWYNFDPMTCEIRSN